MDSIIIRRPDDMHVHLRDGTVLEDVVHATVRRFARAVVMPNLTPPVADGFSVAKYRSRILHAIGSSSFEPLMTFKLLPSTTPELVRSCWEALAVAGKLYPEGVTTNSEDGVTDIRSLGPALSTMEELQMVLCVHGEKPQTFVMDREREYLKTLDWVCSQFPTLKIVLEHITTTDAVQWVRDARPGVAATITVHHLRTTLDDVIGGSLNPHLFCKPIPKRPEDLLALRAVAVSGHPRFFLGSDSAPHAVDHKERCGCAGVFSAPVALEALTEVFEEENALDRLEAFTSEHGAAFYGLPLNDGYMELVRDTWTVPMRYPTHTRTELPSKFVPLLAGKKLRWRLVP